MFGGFSFADLDAHPKLISDFAVRTRTGAFVSLAAIVIAALLFFSELRFFLTTEKLEHMEVDDAAAGGMRLGAAVTGKSMRINFDVTFPDLPCAMVSLDAVDASGTHSMDVLHNIFKRRLDSSGGAVGADQKTGELRTLKSTEELLKEKQRAIADGRPAVAVEAGACGDCYGAGDAGQCCNTCEEVREVYRKKGWQFRMEGVVQCAKEGFYGDVTEQLAASEGCNVYGSLEVPKVPGSFHFAPGHGMQHAYQQVQNLVTYTYDNFNVSHRVNSLSFGPYVPGGGKWQAPLDGRAVTLAEGTGMHQYFVKLVPLIYVPLSGPELLSYQFSVTEHVRLLDPAQAQMEAATGLLPGVFVNYELSPLRVRIEEKRRSLGHFLTNCCAIVGGVFTIMGLVDALLHRGWGGAAVRGMAARAGSKASKGGLID